MTVKAQFEEKVKDMILLIIYIIILAHTAVKPVTMAAKYKNTFAWMKSIFKY